MHKLMLAAFAGILYPFGFAPFHVWPLVPASIALFYIALRGATGQGFRTGFVYGLGVFGVGVSWLYVSIHTYGYTPAWLAVILTALFCMGMSLYTGLLGWASVRLGHNPLVFAGLWLLIDWFRGWFLTGFPWLYPGYAMVDTPLAGLAPLGGIWLVSLATLSSGLGLVALASLRTDWPLPLLALAGWVGSLFLSPGLWVQPDVAAPVPVALVQGNIPQDLKWQLTQQAATREIYRRLTAEVGRPGLVIWPESAMTEFYQDALPFLSEQGERVSQRGGTLITGVPWRISLGDGYRYHNSIAVVSPRESGVYHKQKLVPFGEYVPLQDALRGLIPFFDLPMSSFSRGGPEQPNLVAGELGIAPFICYEILYPELVAQRSRDSHVLLTVSNDAWFGTSFGPLQHFQMTRMRSLETGRWLLRGTNNGVTAVVAPDGEVTARMPQFERGVLEAEFVPVTGETPFMRTGSWPTLLGTLLLTLAPLLRRHSRFRRGRSPEVGNE